MGRVVIAAFKPKTGRQAELLAVVRKHWHVLQGQELVTERPRIAMQAADGTIVEIFEWQSSAAIEAAHKNPAVLALWKEFEACCDYVPVSEVPEAQRVFSEFSALSL